MNPYEPPQSLIEEKKYKEPIINWKLTTFAFIAIYLPFILFFTLKIIYSIYLYYRYFNDNNLF